MDRNLHAMASLVADEDRRRRSQQRVIMVLAVCVTLGLGGLAYIVKELARSQPQPVPIDVSKLPPAKAMPGQ
jgi:hypothetical protein